MIGGLPAKVYEPTYKKCSFVVDWAAKFERDLESIYPLLFSVFLDQSL